MKAIYLNVLQGELPKIVDIKDGDVKYYRDENSTHYVPKRTLDELILD